MGVDVIYNEDCIDGIKKIDDKSIDAVITDPPFFLGVTHNGQKGEYSDLVIMKPFFSALFFEVNRVLKKSGKAYICTDWRTYPFLYPIVGEYLPVKNLLVWDKISGPGNYYAFGHELVIFCSKENCNMKGQNIFRLRGFNSGAKRSDGEKQHPTQKPVSLFEKFILDSTKEGDTVMDCFMGSGTLAIAAIKTKRHYIGFEVQDKYCKIAENRINQYIGEYGKKIENFNNATSLFSGEYNV